MNLIKNLAIARAKKGNGAYHHREKLPSFAPPPSCDIIPPVFYLADTFAFRLFSPFLRATSSDRCNLVPQRTFSSFLRRKYVLFHRSLGNFFDRFVEWTSTIFLRRISRKIMNRERIFSIWLFCGYFVLLLRGRRRGKKNCFLWNTGKTEYLFVCLFIYLFIFNFVCFLLKHRAFEIKIKQYFVFIKCTAHNVVNNKMKIISISR